jgi:hypothetical protein
MARDQQAEPTEPDPKRTHLPMCGQARIDASQTRGCAPPVGAGRPRDQNSLAGYPYAASVKASLRAVLAAA